MCYLLNINVYLLNILCYQQCKVTVTTTGFTVENKYFIKWL